MGRQINASILFLINEVKLSIYRFLTSGAKKKKSNLNRLSWGSTGSLVVGAFNALIDYRCFDLILIGGQPRMELPRLGREGY